MSFEDRNVDILRKAYDLWRDSKGESIAHWVSIMSQTIAFGSLAQGRTEGVSFSRPRHGSAEVENYLRELTTDWEMIDYVVDHFVAQGDRVVMIGHTAWRNKATGKIADTPKVDSWRFDADGKASEFFEYYDTAAIIAAAG